MSLAPRIVGCVLAVALAGGVALVSCPGKMLSPYDDMLGRTVALELTIGEELLAAEPISGRRLTLSLHGLLDDDGTGAWRLRRLTLRRYDADGDRPVLSAPAQGGDDGMYGPDDLATVATMTQVLDASVAVRIDPVEGLVHLAGVSDALAGCEAVADPRGRFSVEQATAAKMRLESLLDDTVLIEGARAAGLGPVPAVFDDQFENFERQVAVDVPGRGRTLVVLRGAVGETQDGLAGVRLKATLAAGAVFTGESDDAPPALVGKVVVEQVAVDSLTQFDLPNHRPWTGSLHVEMPFTGGYRVLRETWFRCVIER